MHKIYADKIVADAADDAKQNPREPMNSYFLEWLRNEYGVPQLFHGPVSLSR